jgi:hypothetical protein
MQINKVENPRKKMGQIWRIRCELIWLKKNSFFGIGAKKKGKYFLPLYVWLLVKIYIKLSLDMLWQRIWEMEVYFHSFLTAALNGSERSLPRVGRFTSAEEATTAFWKEAGWSQEPLGHIQEKTISLTLHGSEVRNVQPVVQSIYWLRYPGLHNNIFNACA